jgi:hypothetical protein
VSAEKEAVVVIQTPDPLPNAEVYSNYLQRGEKYAVEVLAPAGTVASKGIAVTAKLKQFFLLAPASKT